MIAKNRKAYHDYSILEEYEAGIVLKGCEVKSIRAGQITLSGSYARVVRDEVWLFNCHINPYPQSQHNPPDPLRDRKLLLHKREIQKLITKTETKGLTLIPLKLYFKNNKVKLKIGLGQSKKHYDKRHTLKEKAQKRDVAKAFKQQNRK